MSKLPIINFNKMNQILINLGFEKVRQKGSHVFYRHPDGRTTTVPNHAGKDLARPLIREIIREIEIALEDFLQELNKV